MNKELSNLIKEKEELQRLISNTRDRINSINEQISDISPKIAFQYRDAMRQSIRKIIDIINSKEDIIVGTIDNVTYGDIRFLIVKLNPSITGEETKVVAQISVKDGVVRRSLCGTNTVDDKFIKLVDECVKEIDAVCDEYISRH